MAQSVFLDDNNLIRPDFHRSLVSGLRSSPKRDGWTRERQRPIPKTGNGESGNGNGERGTGTGNGEWEWGIY